MAPVDSQSRSASDAHCVTSVIGHSQAGASSSCYSNATFRCSENTDRLVVDVVLEAIAACDWLRQCLRPWVGVSLYSRTTYYVALLGHR